MKIPFYYRLEFRLLKFNSVDDFEQNHYTKEFKNSNPILARNAVFNELHELINLMRNLKLLMMK